MSSQFQSTVLSLAVWLDEKLAKMRLIALGTVLTDVRDVTEKRLLHRVFITTQSPNRLHELPDGTFSLFAPNAPVARRIVSDVAHVHECFLYGVNSASLALVTTSLRLLVHLPILLWERGRGRQSGLWTRGVQLRLKLHIRVRSDTGKIP